jgi:hypothetical protein
MAVLGYIFGIISLAMSLFSPLSAAAAIGTSFGGRILWVHPCSGGIQIAIAPAGPFQPLYVYSVGTIGLPPIHPGQYILGIADAPVFTGTCVGQRIQRDGVSL